MDYLQDTKLLKTSTRGIWFDLLCEMHFSDRSGLITGTVEELAVLGRCTAVEMDAALADLSNRKTADVTFRNNVVTVINRRMRREYLARKNGAIRVQRHRSNGACNASVTPHSQSQNQSHITTKLPERRKRGDFTASQADLVKRLDDALGVEWENDRQKWMGRIKTDFETTSRVSAEVESAIKEGRVKKTPAAYAEQIWKEFSGK